MPGEISITSDMQMTPPLMAESEEELKSFLMKVKEESEKVVLKLNVLKLIGKDSDARRDWGQEEKGMSEDELVGWHH